MGNEFETQWTDVLTGYSCSCLAIFRGVYIINIC
jgi:hypothetical protein